ITMDVAEENGQNYLYIHWIDVAAESGEAAGEAIKGSLEKGTRRVFE
ncbi:MAG: Na+/H+ antiporter subunit E, partial [Oscillospiraceae bacterium]|nr:Na+/H+ antiporter subunit E [Oscillospiraceae bacterium]